jgi:hypothetical protein
MTVQIEVDEKVLEEVHRAIEILNESKEHAYKEAFLDLARKKKREADVSRQYAEAYRKHPQTLEEVEEWGEVQYWEDE